MILPETMAILETLYLLDGGTMLLFSITPNSKICEIRLNQRVNTSGENPGRLLFNDQLTEIRSENEAQLIQLLKNAIYLPIKFKIPETIEIKIANRKFRGDYINQALTRFPTEKQRQFCEQIISYVESDEYIQFARRNISQPTTETTTMTL